MLLTLARDDGCARVCGSDAGALPIIVGDTRFGVTEFPANLSCS